MEDTDGCQDCLIKEHGICSSDVAKDNRIVLMSTDADI